MIISEISKMLLVIKIFLWAMKLFFIIILIILNELIVLIMFVLITVELFRFFLLFFLELIANSLGHCVTDIQTQGIFTYVSPHQILDKLLIVHFQGQVAVAFPNKVTGLHTLNLMRFLLVFGSVNFGPRVAHM